jgi:hypothetical protein
MRDKINISRDCPSPKFIASNQDLERFERALAVCRTFLASVLALAMNVTK